MSDMSRVGEIVLSACDEDWKEVSLFRLKPLEKAVLTVEPEGLRSCRKAMTSNRRTWRQYLCEAHSLLC